jgi:hypothetical protein
MIGDGNDIGPGVQLCNLPDDLDAAVTLDQNINMWILSFIGFSTSINGTIKLPAQITFSSTFSWVEACIPRCSDTARWLQVSASQALSVSTNSYAYLKLPVV